VSLPLASTSWQSLHNAVLLRPGIQLGLPVIPDPLIYFLQQSPITYYQARNMYLIKAPAFLSGCRERSTAGCRPDDRPLRSKIDGEHSMEKSSQAPFLLFAVLNSLFRLHIPMLDQQLGFVPRKSVRTTTRSAANICSEMRNIKAKRFSYMLATEASTAIDFWRWTPTHGTTIARFSSLMDGMSSKNAKALLSHTIDNRNRRVFYRLPFPLRRLGVETRKHRRRTA